MRILLTGGGTAGHVLPHHPIVEALRKKDRKLSILYIGSINGPERKLVQQWGWPYQSIPVGKLRRYFDIKNCTDPFKVAMGIWKAHRIISRFKPQVVFSKGGYVSLPVMIAAWCLKIPMVIHDSDAIPGLTTRLASRFVDTICLGYSEAKKHFPKVVQPKIVITGIPIRTEIFKGNRQKGFHLTGFSAQKPVVVVMGGSLGSQFINRVVRDALPELLKFIQVIHITGTHDDIHHPSIHNQNYKIFEYVSEELPHLYAIADLIVSRAGANTIAEITALGKSCILIPLGPPASHGDQIANAKIVEKKGQAKIILDEELTPKSLIKTIKHVLLKGEKARAPQKSSDQNQGAAQTIAKILFRAV